LRPLLATVNSGAANARVAGPQAPLLPGGALDKGETWGGGGGMRLKG
jgi:hypothetical protein